MCVDFDLSSEIRSDVMKSRAEQREDTRGRIVVAAAKAFSEKGFRAASTRCIASEVSPVLVGVESAWRGD
jgi:AcrR family transcriptional regulator